MKTSLIKTKSPLNICNTDVRHLSVDKGIDKIARENTCNVYWHRTVTFVQVLTTVTSIVSSYQLFQCFEQNASNPTKKFLNVL